MSELPIRPPLFLLGIACACVPAISHPAAAQERSILSFLPTEGRSVAVGDEVRGELRSAGYVAYDGNHVEAWEIRGRAGEGVIVDLLSDLFDPYLVVVGPGLGAGRSDDDGGEGANARACVEFPESATYRIVVGALGGRTGPYTLRVGEDEFRDACGHVHGDDLWFQEELTRLSALPTGDRVLPPEGEVRGDLDPDDPVVFERTVEVWALEASGGQRVSVELRSDIGNAYLFLVGPGVALREDDNGAGGCDARITVTLPETGTYRVAASTVWGTDGGYTLVVAPEPGPVREGPCVLGEAAEEAERALRDVPLVGTLVVDGRPVESWGGVYLAPPRLRSVESAPRWTVPPITRNPCRPSPFRSPDHSTPPASSTARTASFSTPASMALEAGAGPSSRAGAWSGPSPPWAAPASTSFWAATTRRFPLEAKSVTRVEEGEGKALFPDAVTARSRPE